MAIAQVKMREQISLGREERPTFSEELEAIIELA